MSKYIHLTMQTLDVIGKQICQLTGFLQQIGGFTLDKIKYLRVPFLLE